jgi:hypothetical protein
MMTTAIAVAGNEIQFPTAAVQQHAVELARSAVHQVTMDTKAYG